jgi:hypothetical protein
MEIPLLVSVHNAPVTQHLPSGTIAALENSWRGITANTHPSLKMSPAFPADHFLEKHINFGFKVPQ